jgi:hypothetical protein
MNAPRAAHRMAFDRSVRRIDADGRLHVNLAVISKSNVCEYGTEEIPDWFALGLQAGRTYRLYRDPDELAKAVRTFDNLPVLSSHVPVDAQDHRPDLVVGSTGTEAKFSRPLLTNSLVIWASSAIKGVESGRARELSAAYRYVPVMTGGTSPDGEKFDGRMTQIVGNHIAVIPEGRVAGAVIGDAARRHLPSYEERFPHAARIKISA